MIRINKIPPPTVDLYSPDDTFLGTINEYEFSDVRIQIQQSGAIGYYVIDNGARYEIDKYGRLSPFPPVFDIFINQLTKLVKDSL